MLIDKHDYEQYGFLLPKGNRIGKNMQRFLREQLEKQHPCFSDSCCIDAKHTLQKGKIGSRVVVIEKSTLARYRISAKGKQLSIQNVTTKREEVVFSQHTFLRFVPVIALMMLSLAFFLPRNAAMTETVPMPHIVTGAESYSASWSLADIFAAIENNDGHITSFVYNFENANELLKMSVLGLFPEMLPLDIIPTNNEIKNLSAVSFEKKIPQFSIELEKNITKLFSENNAIVRSIPVQVAPIFRNAVFSANGIMLYEHSDRIEYECVIPFLQMQNFLILLEKECRQTGLYIAQVSIAENTSRNSHESDMHFSVRFSQTNLNDSFAENAFPCALLSEYVELFKPLKSPGKAALQTVKLDAVLSEKIPNSLNKIGIITNYGVVTEFIKTNEGKILARDMP